MGCGGSKEDDRTDTAKIVPGDGLGLVVPESMQDQFKAAGTTADTGSSEGRLSDEKILKHVALITNLVWKRYDNDGNGVIDSYEFSTLIGDVMAWDGDNEDKPDPYEVKKFLDEIDENGDGELDRDEFGNFVRDGLSLSDQERLDFAENSPMHARFMLFLENMIIVAEKREAKLSTKASTKGEANDEPAKQVQNPDNSVDQPNIEESKDDDDINESADPPINTENS
eukprot:g2098.t1